MNRLCVNVILTDFVSCANGKLNVLGGGWSSISPGMRFGIGITAKVPWDQSKRSHPFSVELVDARGQRVDEFEVVKGSIEVRRPLGVDPGSFLDWRFSEMFEFPAIPIGSYEFRLWIDGACRSNWRLAFNVVEAIDVVADAS